MIGFKIALTGLVCIAVALLACVWSVATKRKDGDAWKITFGLLFLGGAISIVSGLTFAIWE